MFRERNAWIDTEHQSRCLVEVQAFIASFSEVSFNLYVARRYGQNGFVTGIAYRQKGISSLSTMSVTGTRTSKDGSAIGAEILAAADSDDRTYNLRQSLRSLFKPNRMKPIRSALYVDNKALYDALVTTHEAQDYIIHSKRGVLTHWYGYEVQINSRNFAAASCTRSICCSVHAYCTSGVRMRFLPTKQYTPAIGARVGA